MNTGSEPKRTLPSVLYRSILVGLAYALVSIIAAAVLGPLSRQQPTWDTVLVFWVSGTLLCLALVPFILHSTWSRLDTGLAVWAVILFVRVLGLGIEGSLFKPAEARVVIVGTAVNLVISLLLAWLIVALLFPSQRQSSERSASTRSWWGWTWRVLLVGIAYLVFYFFFGGLNAGLYTRSFYENNPKYGLALPPIGTILLAQLIRGPLFGLGSLFITRSSDMDRRRSGVALGLLLFVVGGFGPYLETTFRSMPLGFNLATLAEIFFQNFLTGLVAARLYIPGLSRKK